MEREEMVLQSNALSNRIIGAAIEVHRQFGPGLLESAYEACLCRELQLRGVAFESQVPIPLEYKGIKLGCGFRIDIWVENLVIVEIKSVEHVETVHKLQLSTYLKITNLWLGLLINFNDTTIKNGLHCIVN